MAMGGSVAKGSLFFQSAIPSFQRTDQEGDSLGKHVSARIVGYSRMSVTVSLIPRLLLDAAVAGAFDGLGRELDFRGFSSMHVLVRMLYIPSNSTSIK